MKERDKLIDHNSVSTKDQIAGDAQTIQGWRVPEEVIIKKEPQGSDIEDEEIAIKAEPQDSDADDDSYNRIIRGKDVEVYPAEYSGAVRVKNESTPQPLDALSLSTTRSEWTQAGRPACLTCYKRHPPPCNPKIVARNRTTKAVREAEKKVTDEAAQATTKGQLGKRKADDSTQDDKEPQRTRKRARRRKPKKSFCISCGYAHAAGHHQPDCDKCPLRHSSEQSCLERFEQTMKELADSEHDQPFQGTTVPRLPGDDLLSNVMWSSFNFAAAQAEAARSEEEEDEDGEDDHEGQPLNGGFQLPTQGYPPPQPLIQMPGYPGGFLSGLDPELYRQATQMIANLQQFSTLQCPYWGGQQPPYRYG